MDQRFIRWVGAQLRLYFGHVPWKLNENGNKKLSAYSGTPLHPLNPSMVVQRQTSEPDCEYFS